jgi:hypothetical protein
MATVPDSARTAAAMPTLVLVRGDEPLLVDRAIAGAVSAARRRDPEAEQREAGASRTHRR